MEEREKGQDGGGVSPPSQPRGSRARRVLVTGGCGFIGTNLVHALALRGDRAVVFDNFSSGDPNDVRASGAEIVRGDVRESGALAAAAGGCDAVVHLAAQTGVIPSQQHPELDFEVNARGTLHALQACRAAGSPVFVYASTGGALMGDQEPPVHEAMAAKPLSPYGASKLAGEGYCSAFFGSFGLNTVALRFANVYGPWSYHKGSVIATFLRCLADGKPLTVYGDGSQTRDYVYVDDLVAAILAAIERAPGGEAFQIASGVETSINELLGHLRALFPGRAIAVRYAPARAGEVQRNSARIEKARRQLSFLPSVPLAEGLRRTWAWFAARAVASTTPAG